MRKGTMVVSLLLSVLIIHLLYGRFVSSCQFCEENGIVKKILFIHLSFVSHFFPCKLRKI